MKLDPVGCWNKLCEAEAANDLKTMSKQAKKLLNWLNQGGECPPVFHGRLSKQFERVMTEICCERIINLAKRRQ